MYTIRKGTQQDIDTIEGIYDRILTQEEAGQSAVGWVRDIYPTRATAQAALDAGELFVLEHGGAVAAAARINQIQVPEYANARWQHPQAPAEQEMELHTLVVDPLQGGKGLGTALVRFYEDYARENGCPYLRMDTNQRNASARALYARLGYQEAGIVDCRFNGISGVRLVCLEKTLA